MSVKSRAYDNDHGEPVVVLVVSGDHDVSRLVNLLNRGNCEQVEYADTIVRQVRRHNGGRAALALLKDARRPGLHEWWPTMTGDSGAENGATE